MLDLPNKSLQMEYLEREIEILHSTIDIYVEKLKKKHDQQNPTENEVWKAIHHCRIEMLLHPVEYRKKMGMGEL